MVEAFMHNHAFRSLAGSGLWTRKPKKTIALLSFLSTYANTLDFAVFLIVFYTSKTTLFHIWNPLLSLFVIALFVVSVVPLLKNM